MARASNTAVEAEGRSLSSSVCVICCLDDSDFFYIGACDHPICIECGLRLRIICESKECPICRSNLPTVYIVGSVRKPFASYAEPSLFRDPLGDKVGLLFESRKAVEAAQDLLAHVCTVCRDEPDFPTFEDLCLHMRREHELHYCDLCAQHLKLYSWERTCYNRTDLATHRRLGDATDRTHRGHPLCRFCDQRFLDNDHLFRHLRIDHFYCHFCDADGIINFYDNYAELRRHFKKRHFLCEEGDCRQEQFTHAFRTEIDLKSHKATTHKDTRKQDLRVTLDWGSAAEHREPHGGRGASSGRMERDVRQSAYYQQEMQRRRERRQNEDGQQEEFIILEGSQGTSKVNTIIRLSDRQKAQTTSATQPDQQNGQTQPVQTQQSFEMEPKDFPRLAKKPTAQTRNGVTTSDGMRNFAGWAGQSRVGGSFARKSGSLDNDDFPTLGPEGRSGNSNREPDIAPAKTKVPVMEKKLAGLVLIDDNEAFPSLSEQKAKEGVLVEKNKSKPKENAGMVKSATVASFDSSAESSPAKKAKEPKLAGAWAAGPYERPATLSQAAAFLTSDMEFPSLGKDSNQKKKLKGQREAKKGTLSVLQAKSVWTKEKTDRLEEKVDGKLDTGNNSEQKEKQPSWAKSAAAKKKQKTEPEQSKQKPKSTAGTDHLVTVGSKTKARRVAQEKQRLSSESTPLESTKILENSAADSDFAVKSAFAGTRTQPPPPGFGKMSLRNRKRNRLHQDLIVFQNRFWTGIIQWLHRVLNPQAANLYRFRGLRNRGILPREIGNYSTGFRTVCLRHKWSILRI